MNRYYIRKVLDPSRSDVSSKDIMYVQDGKIDEVYGLLLLDTDRYYYTKIIQGKPIK